MPTMGLKFLPASCFWSTALTHFCMEENSFYEASQPTKNYQAYIDILSIKKGKLGRIIRISDRASFSSGMSKLTAKTLKKRQAEFIYNPFIVTMERRFVYTYLIISNENANILAYIMEAIVNLYRKRMFLA